jgi:PAS domain S-box-containing protein
MTSQPMMSMGNARTKLVHKQLHREKEFTERLIDSTVEGIFAFDRQCRYTLWNRAMERIFGIRRGEAVGRNAFDLLPSLKETGEDRFFLDALKGRTSLSKERPYRIPETGREAFFEVYYSPIRDASGGVTGPGKVIGGLAILHDITERKQAEESLRELSARVLRSQDEERRRIARELHDSTAQTLSAMALNFALLRRQGSLTSPKAAALIAESQALANQAAEEIRNLSHLLHPPDLDAIGLLPALRWYAARFSERTRVRVELDLPADAGPLPPDVELALFRVTQESLTNVHRHSGSPTARIRIANDKNQITLEVEDQGRGIPPEISNRREDDIANLGIGLAGMRARIRQLGGWFEIASTIAGTKLKATVPLKGA